MNTNTTFGAEFLVASAPVSGGTRPMTVGEYEDMIARWYLWMDLESIK